MIVKDSPAVSWEGRLLALAGEAPDLPGPELERRAARLVDMARPGADQALADVVEAVQVLRDMGGCPANADLYSDHPAGAEGEWGRHLADALHRLNPNGGQS
jgi:hypothetical protein